MRSGAKPKMHTPLKFAEVKKPKFKLQGVYTEPTNTVIYLALADAVRENSG